MHTLENIDIDPDATYGPKQLFPRTREELIMWKLEFGALDRSYASLLVDIYLDVADIVLVTHVTDWLIDLEATVPGAITKEDYPLTNGDHVRLSVVGVELGLFTVERHNTLLERMASNQ
jgi:hypothetical protein